MTKKTVIRLGDKVRVLRSRFVRRVGYPLHYKELLSEARSHAEGLKLMSLLGFPKQNPSHALIEGIARQLVTSRGFGGNERVILYFHTSPELGEDDNLLDLHSLAASSERQFDTLADMPDYTGKELYVWSKRVVHTGKRVAQSGGYDDWNGEYYYEPGYIEDRKTHVLLNTNFGEIADYDVELVQRADGTNHEPL